MTRPAPESDVEPAKALDEIAEQWLCSDVSWSARSITEMHQNMRRSLRAALQKAYDLGLAEERKALREIVSKMDRVPFATSQSAYHKAHGRKQAFDDIRAALDARGSAPAEKSASPRFCLTK